MDTVELLWKIEKHYAIAIPNREAAEMTTVQEICDTVTRHLPTDANPAEVYLEIRKIIAEQAGIDEAEILPHHSITSDLGLD